MPRFYLFRHAQSTNNALRRKLDEEWKGAAPYIRPIEARKRVADPTLTEIGVAQAKNLSFFLPNICLGKTLVACSPFQRTIDTLSPTFAQLKSRDDIDLLCHGLLYELGGCYRMDKTYSGMGSEEISTWFPQQEHIGEGGWFFGRKHRENKAELKVRVDAIITWLKNLKTDKYETIILMMHGALMARIIRALLSIPDDFWITHANTAYTSFLWDEQEGFLLESMNQKSHIPFHLQFGDRPEDGWWPAIYKREVVFHSLINIPKDYPYLYSEIQKTRVFPNTAEIDARSMFLLCFEHHRLCAWVQYDARMQKVYPKVQIDIGGESNDEFDIFVQENTSPSV